MTSHEARRTAWQSLDSGQILLTAAAVVLAVAAAAQLTASGVVQPRAALAFGALIAAGEVARLAMPGGRETAPIQLAGSLGYTLLLSVGGQPASYGPLQVVAVTAVGMLVGALPHVAVARPPGLATMSRRLLAVAVVAFAFRPFAGSLESRPWWLVIVVMMLAVGLAFATDIGIAALTRTETLRARLSVAVRDELRAQGALWSAVGASGVLIAFATAAMGLAALMVFTAPLLATQVAFRRFAGIRATYLQTVRALSRVTEVGGYVESGHSRRVSRLAVATGRDLGMREAELLELEYAALMHDIGQLSLRDPIPGGATVLISPADQRRIAELGAAVIRQTGVLDQVAEIVRRQCDPYRIDRVDRSLPLGSRIIKAVNAYDDLVGGSADRDRAAAALERLRLDTAREYDPVVVAALARVVDRLTPGQL